MVTLLGDAPAPLTMGAPLVVFRDLGGGLCRCDQATYQGRQPKGGVQGASQISPTMQLAILTSEASWWCQLGDAAKEDTQRKIVGGVAK